MSDINENMRRYQAANKSESENVHEINLIDFNEPEIDSVERENTKKNNSIEDRNILSEIGKLTAVY